MFEVLIFLTIFKFLKELSAMLCVNSTIVTCSLLPIEARMPSEESVISAGDFSLSTGSGVLSASIVLAGMFCSGRQAAAVAGCLQGSSLTGFRTAGGLAGVLGLGELSSSDIIIMSLSGLESFRGSTVFAAGGFVGKTFSKEGLRLGAGACTAVTGLFDASGVGSIGSLLALKK